jgi:hypothetical protein
LVAVGIAAIATGYVLIGLGYLIAAPVEFLWAFAAVDFIRVIMSIEASVRRTS